MHSDSYQDDSDVSSFVQDDHHFMFKFLHITPWQVRQQKNNVQIRMIGGSVISALCSITVPILRG